MKMKANTGHTKDSRDMPILCAECGYLEFKRTISETDSIVRLAYTKSGKAVKEMIIAEGIIQFIYQCVRCGATLISDPVAAQ